MRPAGEWQKESACRGTNPDDFFTGQGQNPTAARKLCPTCPVQSECLDYGIMYDERGVWGGKTEKERKSLPVFIKTSLVREAKTLGLWENRPSVEEIVAELRAAVLNFPDRHEPPLEQLEPPAELTEGESDPIFHVEAFRDAM